MVHPVLRARDSHARRAADARLAEAVSLAEAISLEITAAEAVPLAAAKPATLFGRGKVEELKGLIAARSIELVIVDTALSPVQQRNLERAWDCKVIDRTGLILEIFGERAQTREGRLQVELAALGYQRSRLVRSWTHLERQRGGGGFMGGPGETQIEADRRQIDTRITKIRRELETVTRTRGLHRKARRRAPYPVIALVGYTNAGKSTLFNRLTDAEVFAEDLLFATLDPTMREVALPSGRKAILSDTVGFISALPTDLVAAFRATLEEVIEADLVVHVRDISHPDTVAQRDDVLDVLGRLGLSDLQRGQLIEALNKSDLLDGEELDINRNRAERVSDCVLISAATGAGCDGLLALMDSRLQTGRRVIDVSVALADGAAIAWLYRNGEVLSRRDEDGRAHFKVALDEADVGRFERKVKV